MGSARKLLAAAAVSACLLWTGCGSAPEDLAVPPAQGTIHVSISDPPTCAAPNGPYSHVWVTVREVLIHRNADAENNDGGWISLTPELKENPRQIDLLGGGQTCVLAQLGTAQVEPGSYGQIRLLLVANNAASGIANNQCGNAANCVVLAADQSVHTLLLNSQDITGIKIPPSRIAGQSVDVAAGQTLNLNLDFNACASIVLQGNQAFRLKPVVHAGEVPSTGQSISGRVVVEGTQEAIAGGNTVVTLQKKDEEGVSRVVMETLPDSNGAFNFCPVPEGTYEVVAVAVDGSNTAYAATVVTGVQAGNALGDVPLAPAPGENKAPASVTGEVTSANGGGAVAVDVVLSALQAINGADFVTVPLAAQSKATANLATAVEGSCPAGTACASYTLALPAANPRVGAFSANGTTFSQGDGTPKYTVDAAAFSTSTGEPVCTPARLHVNQTDSDADLEVSGGTSVTAKTIAFTGCS
jgi:hypothetical protein